MATCDSEIDRNYDAFQALLPDLLPTQFGQFALLNDQRIIALFDSPVAAVTEGIRRFGSGHFSVQEISTVPENLGFYSYAGGPLQA